MKNLVISKNILNEPSGLLKDFFKDIGRYPIYSSEEQMEFARKAKNGDQNAKDKLVTSNLKFVVTCAKKYTNQGVALIDLIQAGITGLIYAIDNYDPDRGYKFLSFAVWYIRREILKEIYNTGRTIRYPITYIGKITKVKRAYDNFVMEKGREPTDEELINLANITQKQYSSTVLDKSYCQSLDTPLNETTTLEDTLYEEQSTLSDQFTKESISQMLNGLTDREYYVITNFYGLEGKFETSINDIAKDLQLSPERVRQIRKIALRKLKSRHESALKSLL